jgi:hypothetical protein
LPTAASGAQRALTVAGTSALEGSLSRSADGRFLTFAGYDAAPGTAATSSASTTVAPVVLRVFGRMDAAGNVDTSTTTTSFTATSVRAVTSATGAEFWAVAGNTGVVYQPFGGSGLGTVVSATTGNLRAVAIAGGQLYVGGGSSVVRFGAVGTGTPTTGPVATVALPGFPDSTNNYTGVFFADLSPNVPGLDTVYLTDDASNAPYGGLMKWTLSAGGTWSITGRVGLGTEFYRGLTGVVSGTTVTLFATRKSATGVPGELVRVTDTSGYGAAPNGTPTVLVTGATNTAMRGVALAPIP